MGCVGMQLQYMDILSCRKVKKDWDFLVQTGIDRSLPKAALFRCIFIAVS